jgi:hypothetical protein
MKERFPCLNYLRVQPDFAGNIINACATIHNIASKEDFDYQSKNVVDDGDGRGSGLEDEEEATSAGQDKLNELLMYFA